MSKTSVFWHTRAKIETTRKTNAMRCHQCGALLQHPGVSCSTVSARLRWSAVNQYNTAQAWEWPPLDLYDPNWPYDNEALRNVTR